MYLVGKFIHKYKSFGYKLQFFQTSQECPNGVLLSSLGGTVYFRCSANIIVVTYADNSPGGEDLKSPNNLKIKK